MQDELDLDIAEQLVIFEEDGSIAGTLFLWIVADEVQILQLAVQPECRRRGHAEQLLKHAMIRYVQDKRSDCTANRSQRPWRSVLVG